MLLAISYGDVQYKYSVALNLFTAKHMGQADEVRSYGPEDIDAEFRKKNAKTFACKRGGGYWLWKPYVIKKALDSINEGDYVMYLDAGAYYVRSIRNLIRILERDGKDIFLSSSILPNGDWCKADAFIETGCDTEAARRMHQIEPGYLLIKKSYDSVHFIEQWLELCQNHHLLSDEPSVLVAESPNFKENRHDQAMLTLIAYKNELTPYRGISDRSEYKYYVRFKDGEFFGYSRENLRQLAFEEKESEYFGNSNYKRIVVNTRAASFSLPIFLLKVLKHTLNSVWTDTWGEFRAQREICGKER